jgi:hypothetical protein
VAARLVAFDMRGRDSARPRPLPRRPLAIACAGDTVALLDSLTRRGLATITVFGSHAAAVRRQAIAPLSVQGGMLHLTTSLQIDEAGNSLITTLATRSSPLPHSAEASGAVIPASGQPLQPELKTIGLFAELQIPRPPLAALSDGRLAFLTNIPQIGAESTHQSVPATPVTKIEVLEVATGASAANIDIAPANEVLGIALDGDRLTWIQQPVAPTLEPPTSGPSLPTCSFGDYPIGPAILESESLVALGETPITIGSSPVPVACSEGPAPP